MENTTTTQTIGSEKRILTCHSKGCRQRFYGTHHLLCPACTERAKKAADAAPKTEKKYLNGQFFGYIDHRNNSFVVINPGLSETLRKKDGGGK